MIPLFLFAIALAVRVTVGAAFADPAYPDSYYYANLARQLADGHGFQIDYIWNFVDVGGRLPAEPQLPIPSNAHWMPLGALVQVPFIWVLGPTAVAASLPFWLVGAVSSPLAYAIGLEAGAGRPAALTAGALTAIPGGVTPFLSQPDNFGLFVTLAALALWLGARGIRGDRRAFVVGGFVVGLATLARNDGAVLGIPYALAAVWELWRHRRAPRIGLAAAVGCAALFIVVVGPWLWRQLEVFGSISPSAASGRILWITEYRQLYSIEDSPNIESFLGQGTGALLASRLDGLVSAVTIFIVWPLAVVLAPFALIGCWLRRRDARFAPFFLYAGLLFALSAALFAVHVPHGTFIHSAVGLLPHTFILTAIGIAGAVSWIAERRATWDSRQATHFFLAGAVVIAVLAAGVQTSSTIARWEHDRSVRIAAVAGLPDVPFDDVLMSPDPGAYRYLAGLRGIVTPDDPLHVVEAAARAYDVRWLVLERDHIVASLVPVLRGEVRPTWLSDPIAMVSAGPSTDESTTPAAALYAVCLSDADQRCTP